MASITLPTDFPGFPAGTILTQAKPGDRYETADGKLWLSDVLASDLIAQLAKEVVVFAPQPDGTISKIKLPPDVYLTKADAQAAIDAKKPKLAVTAGPV